MGENHSQGTVTTSILQGLDPNRQSLLADFVDAPYGLDLPAPKKP